MMICRNRRAERWEVRCLDTDQPLARRRTFSAACEVRDRMIAGEFVIPFPEPYDYEVDGI